MGQPNACLPRPLVRALADRAALTSALFSRPESLGALSPYDEYLAARGVFLLGDGSLGAVFEVELLQHEPMTEKEVMEAAHPPDSL